MGQDYPKPPPSPKKNLHPHAGEASPVTLRALAALQREQPSFPKGVQAPDMKFDDMLAFTNVLGAVSPDDHNTIQINPAISMLYPEREVKRTLAHEGQHINQLRAGKGDQMKHAIATIPYGSQPHEQEADMVADSYNIPQTDFSHPEWGPLNRWQGVIQGLFDSGPIPALKRKLIR